MRITLPVAIVAIALGLAACKPAGPDLSTAFVNLRMQPDVTHQEAEATIAVTELVNVQLPVQAGTGYAWELAQPLPRNSPVAFTQSSREQAGAPEDITVGGREWFNVSFVGRKLGTETVTMVYRRPWEAPGQIAKTYRITITVTKSPDGAD